MPAFRIGKGSPFFADADNLVDLIRSDFPVGVATHREIEDFLGAAEVNGQGDDTRLAEVSELVDALTDQIALDLRQLSADLFKVVDLACASTIRAVRIGRALRIVKQCLRHGEFGHFLTRFSGCSVSTLNRYMKLSEEADERPEILKADSLRQAYESANILRIAPKPAACVDRSESRRDMAVSVKTRESILKWSRLIGQLSKHPPKDFGLNEQKLLARIQQDLTDLHHRLSKEEIRDSGRM